MEHRASPSIPESTCSQFVVSDITTVGVKYIHFTSITLNDKLDI